ncbi:clavesin-2-like [Schistocerca americana]|uniref:clavesin-2-like n=1 Tax=Schistocerca americana TaxID=7009 RepID=UPI001F4F8F5C|nr:clavesin-2-like [Schistocerca americana]
MPADKMFPGLVLPPKALEADGDIAVGKAAVVKHAPLAACEDDDTGKVCSALPPPPPQPPPPQLPPEWQRRAQEELNERPDTLRQDIDTFRSMVVAEKNLHVRTDDDFLLRFLRARKFNCAKAFHMLQRYYVMKLRCPELFRVPRPSEKRHILEMQVQNMLDDRDGYGRRVYIFRVERCDAAQVSIEDIFRTNVLALEQIVQEPETQVAGLTVLVDMNGFGLQHAKFLSPYYARRTVEVIQETFPLRFKGFHVINQPFYFDAVFAVLKPFLKDKIRRRIYLHGRDLNSLHAFISPDILPQEYGGQKPPFDNQAWRMKLLANEDKFVELETYGYKVDELPVPEEDDFDS